MGFPSLGALLQVGVPALGGSTAGANQGRLITHRWQQEDEERKAEQQRQQLQMALLQVQIAKASQPQGWEPMSKQDYLDTHPHNPPQTENIDALSEAGTAAKLKYRKGELALEAAQPKPPTQEEATREARGTAILSQMGQGGGGTNEQKHAFTQAYAAIIAQHPDWSPGRISEAAAAGTNTVDPTLRPQRLTGFAAQVEALKRGEVPPGESVDTTAAPLPGVTAPTVPTPPTGDVQTRIAALRAEGKSKEEARAILQQEGYLDADGNVVAR